MQLEDIPTIRQRYQDLLSEYEKAEGEYHSRIRSLKRTNGKHIAEALKRVESDRYTAFHNYDIGLENLTYALFGSDLGLADPSDVLDWIEHFLQEPSPL